MDNIEKAIRENFAGPDNKALRAIIRKAAATGQPYAVRAIASRVGLTPHRGIPSLEAVAQAVEAEKSAN